MLECLPCANEILAILRTITGPDLFQGDRPDGVLQPTPILNNTRQDSIMDLIVAVPIISQ